MHVSLRHLLLQLLERIHRARERAGQHLSTAQWASETLELRALLDRDRVDWQSPDARHVAFHMLTAVMWSRTAAPSPGSWPLSAWLGQLFDNLSLQRRFRRSIADLIVRWANRWLCAFATLRGRLLVND
jgi:hypothetical protein